jgi:hypothetical protein
MAMKTQPPIRFAILVGLTPGLKWLHCIGPPLRGPYSEVPMNRYLSSPWLQQLAAYRCRDCGSEVGFRSRRRTFSERYILPLLLLQPVRCGTCFRRDYRLILAQVRDRLPELQTMIPAHKVPAAHERNVA